MGKLEDLQTQQRTQAVLAYERALELGDFTVITVILGEAESDPVLEAMLLKVDRTSQARHGVSIHATQLRQARHFLSVLNDEVLERSERSPFMLMGDKKTGQERISHIVQREISSIALPAGERTLPQRQVRFPRTMRFMQTVAAVFIVCTLSAGFLLLFSGRFEGRQPSTLSGTPSAPGIYISRLNEVSRLDSQTRKVLWQTHIDNSFPTQGILTVIGDTVYALSQNGNVVSALNAETGALLWSHTFPSAVGLPFVDQGQLYVSSAKSTGGLTLVEIPTGGSQGDTGFLWSVNPTTGSIIATYTYGGQQMKSTSFVAVVNGVLYYADTSGGFVLFAEQLSNEKLLWKQNLTSAQEGVSSGNGITVQNGVVYLALTPDITYQDGWVYALDAQTGKTLWQSPGISNLRGMTVTSTMLYVTASFDLSGELLAFARDTHALIWQKPYVADDVQVVSGLLSMIYSVKSDVNYPPSYDGIAILDTNTGDVLWKTPLNHVGGYQVKGMVNGVLYAISWTTMTTEGITGTVFALNAQTGAQLWSIPTGVPLTQWGDMVVL